MNLVGRSASSVATRRLFNRGYIGVVTHARGTRPTLDQIDSSPSRTRSSNRQARIGRQITTTSIARHAEPLSDAYLDFSFSADTTMASLTPPQPPPSWQHTVEDIERLTTEALTKNKQVSDDIVQLPDDKLDFDNVSTLAVFLSADRLTARPFFRCL